MTFKPPDPAELVRVARNVVWYQRSEESLSDLPNFLARVMVYGSPADVCIVEQFAPVEEFRKA